MRLLFGTSSWGLGHATRDLLLMRKALDAGHELTVVSTGRALVVLRTELERHYGRGCAEFIEWPDMPESIAHTAIGFYGKTVANIPRILTGWFLERRRLNGLLSRESFDVVVSDHRYGMVTGRVASYFLTHSLRYITPWRILLLETLIEAFLSLWISPTAGLLIADEREECLSGEMSSALRYYPRRRRVFLGMLSTLRVQETPVDVDVFVSISGPEPQRTILEHLVLRQLGRLPGYRIVVALGKPGSEAPRRLSGAMIYPYLGRREQQEMMNRSRLVVCRSGYTTLMELATLGKPALLVPTPGQSEQNYLAKSLAARGYYHTVRQDRLDLARDVPIAMRLGGFRAKHPPEMSAENFAAAVLAGRPTRGAASGLNPGRGHLRPKYS